MDKAHKCLISLGYKIERKSDTMGFLKTSDNLVILDRADVVIDSSKNYSLSQVNSLPSKSSQSVDTKCLSLSLSEHTLYAENLAVDRFLLPFVC